jgi:membrane protease YdiL (CAAX protease family)
MLLGSAIAGAIDTGNSGFRIDVSRIALVLYLVSMALAVALVAVLLWRLVRPEGRRRRSSAAASYLRTTRNRRLVRARPRLSDEAPSAAASYRRGMNSTSSGGIQLDVSLPLTEAATPPHTDAAVSAVEIPQYGRRAIFAIWAAAALPMAALAWLVAPRVADHLSGEGNVRIAKALLALLTVGLVWQFVLVAVLVWREQRTLRWSVVRDALWLRSPRSPRSGRVGGRVWLIVIPLILAFGVEEIIPTLPYPGSHDFATFLSSHAGQSFMHGAWGWFGVMVVLWVFNTVLGEELLFRGFLLPRMKGAFGRGDWAANGVLFATYHLHMPWVIPTVLLDGLILAYPTKRYQSAWIGIVVHSIQSLVLAVIVFTLVV